MPHKSLKFLLKNKWITLPTFLLFIIIGFVLPQTASAEWYNPTSWFGASVSTAIGYAMNLGITVILAIPTLISATFSFVAGTLLRLVLNISVGGVSYTSTNPSFNPAVAVGWPIVRDFANIIVVLGLVVIALATILRWPEGYDAKKLLGKLIIAALLINFSLVICGIIIDASNITTRYLLTGGQQNTTNAGNFIRTEEFSNVITLVTNGFEGDPSPWPYIAKAIGLIFFNIAQGIVAFLYVFLFLFRMIALWILVILSPLAFICAVFPFTQKYYETWKSNFIQWCIISIPGAFFLYLGDKIMAAMLSTAVASPFRNAVTLGAPTGVGTAGAILQGLTGLFTFAIPGSFLIIGFLVSLQTSAQGASYAISAGKKSGSVLGKFTGRRIEQGYNKAAVKLGFIKEGGTVKGSILNTWDRTLEKTGIQGAGYAKKQEQDRLAAASKEWDSEGRIAAGGDALQRQVIAAGPGTTEAKQADFSAAIRAQQKDGKKVSEKALDQYNNINKDTSVYSKDPDLAHRDTVGINEILAKKGKILMPGKSNSATSTEIDEAIAALKRKSYDKMDTKTVKDMNPDDLVRLAGEKTAEGAKAMEEAIKRGILERVRKEQFAGSTKDLAKRISHNKVAYGSDVKRDAYKTNPYLRKYHNKEEIKKRAIDDGTTEKEALNNLLDETYTGLDAKGIKDMEEAAFTLRFLLNTTGKKLARAGDLGLSLKKKNKLKDLVRPGSVIVLKHANLKTKEKAARSGGNIVLADKLKIEMDKLLDTISAIKKL